jgi:hypothetical protein
VSRAWLEVASVGYLAWRAVARSVRGNTALYDGGRAEVAMADPVGDIIGDYRAFAAQQRDRLAARGIDITPYELSHLAVRVPEWDQYVHLRTLLERHAVANRENVWNGRPISLIVPAEPLEVLGGIGWHETELPADDHDHQPEHDGAQPEDEKPTDVGGAA